MGTPRSGILKAAPVWSLLEGHTQHPLQDRKTWYVPQSRWGWGIETWEQQEGLGTKELEKNYLQDIFVEDRIELSRTEDLKSQN